MINTLILEMGGDGWLRAITSGDAESKVFGKTDVFGNVDQTLVGQIKESIQATGDGGRVVIVLPQVAEAKQARVVADNWSRAGIEVFAVLGRAAIAEKAARLA